MPEDDDVKEETAHEIISMVESAVKSAISHWFAEKAACKKAVDTHARDNALLFEQEIRKLSPYWRGRSS